MNTGFDRRILHRSLVEPDLAALQYPAHASSRSRLFAYIPTVEYYISTWISPEQDIGNNLPSRCPEAIDQKMISNR